MSETKWKTYEEVSRHLLNEFKEYFGLIDVEGKQIIKGNKSGTDWEIDAKGLKEGNKGFIVIECRNQKNPQKQKDLAALAFTIQDTGAEGGIIVSPLDIQIGAKKVAKVENIIEVTLNPEPTITEYLMEFLDKVMMGFEDKFDFEMKDTFEIFDEEGNKIR